MSRMKALVALAALMTLATGAACDSEKAPPRPPGDAPRASASASASSGAGSFTASRFPDAKRIVAIGDLHGDLSATRAALRLAGAIDENDHWAGGPLVLVQTGDQLDRGDDERAIVDLFDRLVDEATRAGGTVHPLNGNHEIMNVAGDFRYVTQGGYRDFANVSGITSLDPRLSSVPVEARPRAGALFPGGPYAKRLSKRNTIVIVGDTVFVHGGVLPAHVKYGIDRINREVSAWMNGDSRSPPEIIMAEDAPIWSRVFAEGSLGAGTCETLGKVLTSLSVKRMVIGHTVQKGGISSACDGKVWRIDVGLASFYGGPTEVLEIAGPEVRPLRKSAAAVPAASASASASAASH